MGITSPSCGWLRLSAWLGAGLLAGCAPEPDLDGIYFPGWFVALLAGAMLAYLVTWPLRAVLGELIDIWRISLAILFGTGLFFLCFAT